MDEELKAALTKHRRDRIAELELRNKVMQSEASKMRDLLSLLEIERGSKIKDRIHELRDFAVLRWIFAGVTYEEIAKAFNITKTRVSLVKSKFDRED